MSTSHNGHDDMHATAATDAPHEEHHEQDSGSMNKTIATVAVVAVGAALLETALLPGLALGVAAVAAPKYLPRLGASLTPLFRSTVRGTYKLAQKSKEMFAEAHEQVNDIVAEVKAENESFVKEANGQAHPAA
jgi:hypothetical protein